MKHIKIMEKSIFLAFGVVCLLYAACMEPSPLYGTWSDNRGNTFSFFEDGTFNAKVTFSNGITINYEGNYSVLQNAMTLNCSNVELQVVTEWDLRGNMLFLDWVNEDGITLSMTLYKISN